MPGFLSNITLEPNPIEQRRAARVASGLRLIDLTDSNPTSCGVMFPNDILRAAADRYLSNRTYAPDARGLERARISISEWYRARTPSLHVSPENIFLTASTSESYALLFSLLADAGDHFLFPDVSYPLFEHLAHHQRVEGVAYHLDPTDWSIHEASVLASASERTRGVVLISPHNPTGSVYRNASNAIERIGVPLIVDEVFAPLTADALGAPPVGALHPHLPVFHLNGISKMFALPDLKLGWIAMNDRAAEQYADRLAVLNDAFLSSSSLAQSLVPELFSERGLSFVEAVRVSHRRKMERATRVLNDSGNWECSVPDGGAFLFPRYLHDIDEDELVCELIDRGVFAYPGYYFGEKLGARVFLSTLLPDARLDEAVGILAAFSKGH
ncbi:MAG: pyridoxal phosphate-dependent aminotransferase [Deltaproteobacteria bacterium]|nr:pyridoxal phosphate-dependent aminotransferase [Deltaproteobacteria bacterium]